MYKLTVGCPQCGNKVIGEANNQFRPFCSERCKLNDLSQWAQESYRIPQSDNDYEHHEATESLLNQSID